MRLATKVRCLNGFRGDAALFRLSESVQFEEGQTDHVVVSSVNAMFTGPETLIFPANSDGEILDWIELNGSYRGGYEHAKALRGAGFEVVE